MRDPCLQDGGPSPENPVLCLVPLQVSGIHRPQGGGGLPSLLEPRDRTPGPTRHTVAPDLEEDPGLTQDPGVYLNLKVGHSLDLDLPHTLGPGPDPDHDHDLGTDPGRVYRDPQEKEKPVNPNQIP